MWSPSELLANLHGSTAAGLLVAMWLGYKVLSQQRLQAKLRHLPRPKSTLPLLGNTLDLVRTHRARIHDWLLDESLRHGGKAWLFQSLGREPFIVLTQESHFEDVIKTHFDAFEKGPQLRELGAEFFGETGIFVADGTTWRHQRKTASHLFSHHMMRESMASAIAQDTRAVLRKLTAAQAGGTPVELKLLMDALTTDVFTKIGFGVRLGCLDDLDGSTSSGDSPQSNAFDGEFHRAFSRCPMVIHSRSQQPMFLWKLKRWLQLGEEKQFTLDMKRINDAIFRVIEDSMARNQQSEMKEKNLISLFLSKEATVGDDGKQVPVKPELIRDMALNFIAAGRGTTGQSLAWFVIMMSRYPHVYENVLRELQSELPRCFDVNDVDYVPTMEDVASLTYLEAAIKESLRLNPAAPLNNRLAMQDIVLSDGTFIPKGVRVVIPTYATARLPWMWGDDAAEFKPERWIDAATGKLKQISNCKFLVFHGGPRICLGVKLAMLEMKIALAAMLSKFEFVMERDPFEISYDTSLSLPIKGELFARVQPVAMTKIAAAAPESPIDVAPVA